MNIRAKHFVVAAVLALGFFTQPLVGQTTATGKVAVAPKNSLELLITSSARPDGASAEVQLTSAGLNGVEIHQLRSEKDQTVIAKAILGQVASSTATNLAHTRLILEKEVGVNRIVLVLHPMATPGKSIRLILPAEATALTGAVTMGIINHPIDDHGDGGTGSGGGGCYPVSWTSERCGTITNCCPTTAVDIDGVNCVITCR